MPETIAERLAALPRLSRVALCELWKKFFNASPSPRLRKNLMVPILAYRMQQQEFGSLSPVIRTRLGQLARTFENDPRSSIPFMPAFKPGTRLVREWRDQVHLVNVETNGYEYRGARYRSLSEIARVITGARWSGPLFFGIKRGQNTSGKEIQ